MRKELSILVARREDRESDRERIRHQRKELEELRITNENLKSNEEEMRRQLCLLKVEKEKMLREIKELNDKQAVEMYVSSENTQMQNLRAELRRAQEDATNRQA